MDDNEREDDIVLFANGICADDNYHECFHYVYDVPTWITDLYWRIDGSAWLVEVKEAKEAKRA